MTKFLGVAYVEASNATPAPKGSETFWTHTISALTVAAAFAAPSGTPLHGSRLVISVLDNGTARALTWNAIYRAMGVALPSTTVAGKWMYMVFIYNAVTTTWDLLGVNTQG